MYVYISGDIFCICKRENRCKEEKKKLLYSVIIPIYNSDKYLRACLNSILQQVFKEYEIILVDDGSVDDSGNICDEYARKYSNISVYHQKNAGPSAARNLGMKHAREVLVVCRFR